MMKPAPSDRGQTLIALLVVIVIMGVLWGVFFGPGRSAKETPKGEHTTVPGQAIDRGKSVECMNNLQQIRAAIQAARTGEEANPSSLNDLKLPASMLQCPVGNEAYAYDPATGGVRCVHQGHEKF